MAFILDGSVLSPNANRSISSPATNSVRISCRSTPSRSGPGLRIACHASSVVAGEINMPANDSVL
jgi:hypothetical protein